MSSALPCIATYCFARHYCPPVLRVVAEWSPQQPMAQRTLLWQPGESAATFTQRAELEAYQLWLRGGCSQAMCIECYYAWPSDPHFFDDQRAADLALLRRLATNERDSAEVRIAAIKALNRLQGLAPAEEW